MFSQTSVQGCTQPLIQAINNNNNNKAFTMRHLSSVQNPIPSSINTPANRGRWGARFIGFFCNVQRQPIVERKYFITKEVL